MAISGHFAFHSLTRRALHGNAQVLSIFFFQETQAERSTCSVLYRMPTDAESTLQTGENDMSALNGDKARYNKDRRRKLLLRQRVRLLRGAPKDGTSQAAKRAGSGRRPARASV
jgi:hypothetical protein